MESPKLATVILLIFVIFVEHGSGNRQKYGGRVLNISPKECTSTKFPNLIGTCMISLECQQRSGTVIGACRDGVLFGACCHDANAVVTTELPQTVMTSTTTMKSDPTTSSLNILPVRTKILTLLTIQKDSEKKNDSQDAHKTVNKSVSPVSLVDIPQNLEERVPSEDPAINSGTSSQTNAPTTSEMPEVKTVVSTTIVSENRLPVENVSISDKIESSEKSRQEIREEMQNEMSTSTEVTTVQIVSNISNFSVETTTATTTIEATTEATTIPSTLPKFFYGKIKYSPKPIKFRATTKKTVWTRPPTTETSYSIFASSEEEDEDEFRKPTRRGTTQKMTISTAISSDASTNGLLGISEEISPSFQNSTEETTIPSTYPVSAEETTITSTKRTTTQENTTAYRKYTEEITAPYLKPTEESTSTNAPSIDETTVTGNVTEGLEKGNQSINQPQKNVRIVNPTMLHRKGVPNGSKTSDDDSSYSTSAGWDNKLDDFVNQVVEGIAEELDKSNIDDVVFKSSSTTTTTKKPKTTSKPSKKSTEKIAITKRKPKPKGSSTRRNESSKQKKKPAKKVVTISKKNEDSAGKLLDYRKDCGVRPLARKSRIVGGSPSTHGSWPWHALVKETVWWGIFSKIKCGGVLIGSRHVLTAAHCQPQQTGKLSVVLGVTDSDNPNANAVTKGVRRVIRHPQFNPKSYENDIAVLELDSPVEFQPHIVPICMPDLKEVFEGSEGFVTGMGLLRHDGERPLVLHEVDVPILNNSDCQRMFRKSGNSKPIKESFICAGYPQGLKDSCGGDSGSYPNVPMRHYRLGEESINETVTEFFSGGPLSVRRSNGQWVLAGTVSHGISCALPNQPGIYSRTTYYRPWIEKVTRLSRGQDSPKCHGPSGSCDYRQTQSKGIFDTLFRVLRLARKFWKSRK